MNPTIYSQVPGDGGVFQTVQIMKGLVNKNFLNLLIRERAASIVQNCNRKIDCEHYGLLGYVRSAIQYVRDPTGVEALHDPVTFYEARLRNLQSVFGDCDDMSTYLATLLKSIGHPPFFRILSRTGNSFHHVHVICHGKLLDPTLELGNFPRQATRAVQIKI
jgi:hypothetical protein